jgi:proline iminopeptidase
MDGFRVPVEGGHVVAWRSGSGAPALLMHGGPGVNEYLEDLAEELDGVYECVRYQQRGLSPSDAPGPYSVDQFIADATAVLDTMGWDEATIAGHSWGGSLAQHFVAAHPERSTALISIDGVGGLGPDGGWDEFDKTFVERFPEELKPRIAELDAKYESGEMTDAEAYEGLEMAWPYYFFDPENAPPMPPTTLSNEVYAHIHESLMGLFKEGRPEKGLREFAKPALFVHGDSDPVPLHTARATAEVMPKARFVTFERCGHFPWMEHPGVLRAAIEKWLASA